MTRPLTLPTLGKPYVRQPMPGHRMFQTLTRRERPKIDRADEPMLPLEVRRGRI